MHQGGGSVRGPGEWVRGLRAAGTPMQMAAASTPRCNTPPHCLAVCNKLEQNDNKQRHQIKN